VGSGTFIEDFKQDLTFSALKVRKTFIQFNRATMAANDRSQN
jgi:hypothetical protein